MSAPSSSQQQHLKAAVRIGTIHGRVNYKQLERAFHNKDVNEENKQKKIEVKKGSRKDILGLEKKKWEASVAVHDAPVIRCMNQNRKHDPTVFRYNYRAETLSKSNESFLAKSGRQEFDKSQLHCGKETTNVLETTKRVEEMPVHPKLSRKSTWNHSTELDKKRNERISNKEMTLAQKRSEMKSKRLEREGYMNPTLQQISRMQELREEKERRLSGISLDVASESKVEDNDQNQEKQVRSRPVPSRKYKEYYNDGVYEYSEIEGCHVWSCSMNPNPEFRGSCFKVRNPDAWNFASP